jgi:hypothetical protein
MDIGLLLAEGSTVGSCDYQYLILKGFRRSGIITATSTCGGMFMPVPTGRRTVSVTESR